MTKPNTFNNPLKGSPVTNPDPSTETLRLAALDFTRLAGTLGQTRAARALAHQAHYDRALQKLQDRDIPGCLTQLQHAATYMETPDVAA